VTAVHLDPERLRTFADLLRAHRGKRIQEVALWDAFNRAFPHRPQGREEQEWMHSALTTLTAEGLLQLPAPGSPYWRRGSEPRLPLTVTRIDAPVVRDETWRRDPWHPRLAWVPTLTRLTTEQVAFLRRVHQGLVDGWFETPAPLRYRSLQLTYDDKRLEDYMKSPVLFGAGRLSPDLLAFYTPVLPLAWERVGPGGHVLAFENKEPFYVARSVLAGMSRPPFGMVAYGGGNEFPHSVTHLATIDCRIESLNYVGDLDGAGLAIAIRARARALGAGLPELRAAPGFHRMMLNAAARFGRPDGWPPRRASVAFDRAATHLPPEVREDVLGLIANERRISEEVLGPIEMAQALGACAT
jgi:hypothetical protein